MVGKARVERERNLRGRSSSYRTGKSKEGGDAAISVITTLMPSSFPIAPPGCPFFLKFVCESASTKGRVKWNVHRTRGGI